MKKWVKEELRKNPAEQFLLHIIGFVKANKSRIISMGAVLLVILLVSLLYLRVRSNERSEAAVVFARAQSDFENFSFSEAASALARIIEDYPRSGILDQALFLKGSSYYELGDLERSSELLSEALEKFPRSRIRAEIAHSLAEVMEEKGEFSMALEYYLMVPDAHYLKPSAEYATARIYEIADEPEKAIRVYTRLSAHYGNTFWGEFASKRIGALSEATSENGPTELDSMGGHQNP